jgi:membrane-bound lytic murein transglycosylase
VYGGMLRTSEAEFARLEARTQGAFASLRNSETQRDNAKAELEREKTKREEAEKERDEALRKAEQERMNKEGVEAMNKTLIGRSNEMSREVERLLAELGEKDAKRAEQIQVAKTREGKVKVAEEEDGKGNFKADIAPELLEEWRKTVTADWEGRMLAGKSALIHLFVFLPKYFLFLLVRAED